MELADGGKLLIEIKPQKRAEEPVNQAKEAVAKEKAAECGYQYKMWNEQDLYGTEDTLKKMQAFLEWLKGINQFEQEQRRIVWDQTAEEIIEGQKAISKRKHSERQQRYYRNNVQNDKVEVWCDFCQEQHTIMELSYRQNVARNARYICLKENGHLTGKNPKAKIDPLSLEGKKQCGSCKDVKLTEEFNKDKSRTDGLCNICRECNCKRCTAHYEKKKQ